ncbi:MAG TPA: hypothetical protein VHV32_19420 [Candidatus Angelobacter sp.]|jgi:hypothetical protein|nr:hypothetical protein [Candidatus Angelobacter sp.]
MKKLILFSVILCGCAVKHAPKFQPTPAEEQLMRDYYGKPYLDAPKGWHWVCSDLNIPSERCYIDKDNQ